MYLLTSVGNCFLGRALAICFTASITCRASFRRKKLKKGKKSAAPTEKAFAELPETGAPIESWEIPRSKITDLRQIGEGNFGLVYIGQVSAAGAEDKLVPPYTLSLSRVILLLVLLLGFFFPEEAGF